MSYECRVPGGGFEAWNLEYEAWNYKRGESGEKINSPVVRCLKSFYIYREIDSVGYFVFGVLGENVLVMIEVRK